MNDLILITISNITILCLIGYLLYQSRQKKRSKSRPRTPILRSKRVIHSHRKLSTNGQASHHTARKLTALPSPQSNGVSNLERIMEKIQDREVPAINLSEYYAGKVYVPDAGMYSFFRQKFVEHYLNLNDAEERYFGYSKSEIKEEIIGNRLNLRSIYQGTYGLMSPEHSVLAYCFFNLRKYFYIQYHIFDMIRHSPEMMDISRLLFLPKPITFIDLGCGVLSKGLAYGAFMAEKFQHKLNTQYIGIDIAPPLLDKAHELSNCFVFNSQSQFSFHTNLVGIPTKQLHKVIVLNCSDVFFDVPSDSKFVKGYARFVRQVMAHNPLSKIILIYQSPNIFCPAFEAFKQYVDVLQLVAYGQNTIYYQQQNDSMPTTENIRYEVLTLV